MKLKAKRPFGLKFEIFDPEDGSLLGGGSNRALVSKNASAGIKRATTTDPAALSLGAVREGGIEGKYRVSIFQGNQPLTHESFRSKKNAIAYAVDWKERKRRNIYGFSAKLRLREFSALRKRIRVKWHPDGSARMTIRDQHGSFNEIGRIETTDSSIVDWQKQKLATRGQIKHAWIDPKFRGMGLATKMYGEAMKQAPRGRLVSDNAQFDGGYAIWNRLQRNKGYKIRENPKADGAEDGFLSRDKRPLFIGRINPAARKQSNFSAKLRLREFSALSDTEKAVFRHYYRKLKKQTRGGEFAVKADSSLLWRGATRPEIESIADNGRFVSNWQTKGVSGTWVTSDPSLARSYAAGHAPKHSRIYAISSDAFKRVNNKTLAAMAAQRDDLWARNVAPLRGGIFQHEVRGILKPFPRDKKRYVGWRPVSLGDVQNRNFSAKLQLREFSLSDTEKAVFRHYYRKLKKQTRGGKFADGLSGYMPDHSKPSSLLWRGTNRAEVEAISDNGKFISRWQHFLRPGSSRTWVTSRPKIAESYAAHGSVRDSRIYAISPAAFKRVDNKVRDQMSGTTVTAPIRGGIFRHEVRGILKGSDGGLNKYGQKKLRWRPVPLGDVQNRNFSAKIRLQELSIL